MDTHADAPVEVAFDGAVAADPGTAPREPSRAPWAIHPVKLEPWVDGPVLVGLAAYAAGTGLVEPSPPWRLDVPADDGWLPGIDRAALDTVRTRVKTAGSLDAAARWSDNLLIVSAFVPLAASAVQIDGPSRGGAKLEMVKVALVSYEAVGASWMLNDVVKRATGRPRPYVVACAGEADPTSCIAHVDDSIALGDGWLDADAHQSFYSGHTATVAAAWFSAATFFAEDGPNDVVLRYALPYGAAAAATITTGVLRVEAGRHYPTDVLVGGLLGASIGVLVPELHLRTPVSLALAQTDAGAALALQGRW